MAPLLFTLSLQAKAHTELEELESSMKTATAKYNSAVTCEHSHALHG